MKRNGDQAGRRVKKNQGRQYFSCTGGGGGDWEPEVVPERIDLIVGVMGEIDGLEMAAKASTSIGEGPNRV